MNPISIALPSVYAQAPSGSCAPMSTEFVTPESWVAALSASNSARVCRLARFPPISAQNFSASLNSRALFSRAFSLRKKTQQSHAKKCGVSSSSRRQSLRKTTQTQATTLSVAGCIVSVLTTGRPGSHRQYRCWRRSRRGAHRRRLRCSYPKYVRNEKDSHEILTKNPRSKEKRSRRTNPLALRVSWASSRRVEAVEQPP